jgi:FkbM family methyltransferase
MSLIDSPIRAGSFLVASRLAHKLLTLGIRAAYALMGVGTAGRTALSGEAVSVKRLRPGAVIFDVGANVGQFATLAQTVPNCKLYCFEPGKHTFAALSENIHRATLFSLALAAEPGTLTLHYDHAGSGLASLTKRRLDHHGIGFEGSEQVDVETMDRMCAQLGVTSIDLLKIDVEGHELDVLRGAKDMLAKRAIGSVQFEFGGCNIDTRTFFQDFYYFFKDAGMVIHRITPSGYLHPITQYRELNEQFGTTNYLAIRY